MPHAKHDTPDSLRLKQAQLMHGKGLAVYFQQRLWHSLRDRPQPFREATGENRNRQQWILLRMCHHRGPGTIKLHADFAQSSFSHHRPNATLLLRIEHEKSAATGADEFA